MLRFPTQRSTMQFILNILCVNVLIQWMDGWTDRCIVCVVFRETRHLRIVVDGKYKEILVHFCILTNLFCELAQRTLCT